MTCILQSYYASYISATRLDELTANATLIMLTVKMMVIVQALL
jgi:hypothetical protein